MARKQTIIIYPHLNDCGGDLSKDWYVEYKWRLPGDPKQYKERVYKGLNGTATERYAKAESIIEEKTEWFKSGEYLKGNTRRVYEDELLYRSEAQIFGKMKENVVTVRMDVSEFLREKKGSWNYETYLDNQSRLRMFCNWIQLQKLDYLDVVNIKRNHIIQFFIYLSETKGLSRITIDKYIQIVGAFFEWELIRETIQTNPVIKIPRMGKIVDKSPVPFTKEEREKLKNLIGKEDPWLWLACQIQYYCAIRPGTELRLMKINWIDFDNQQIRIPNEMAKNNRTEIVEIPDPLFEEFIRMKLHYSPGDYYVFGNKKSPGETPFGKNNMRNRFNVYRDALNIPSNKTFYAWKHTGAIELIENGAQPYDVMDHLRHKNFDTTEKYLKKRIKNKSKKISKFSSKI